MFNKISGLLRRFCFRETIGTEIIEFAVSMPLLVVLAVGIYDFGSALTLKHKLSTAVREGARIASSQYSPPNPTVSESCGTPRAICMARDAVASDLQASMGTDCGLGGGSGSYTGGPTVSWTFTGSCSGLSLQVERAVINPNAITLPDPWDDAHLYQIENSRVTLVYPYQWQFSRIFNFIGNANYLSPTITVSSTMQNLD